MEIAVLVQTAQVAGGEPAVRVDRGRRRVRSFQYPGDHRRAAELDLAHALAVGVADAKLGADQGDTDRTGLAGPAGGERGRDPAQLRQPVALDHPASERLLEVARDALRHGRAADVGDADGRQLAGGAGGLAQRDAHRRHAEQDGRARLRHRRERLRRLEPPDDRDRPAGQQCGDDAGR